MPAYTLPNVQKHPLPSSNGVGQLMLFPAAKMAKEQE